LGSEIRINWFSQFFHWEHPIMQRRLCWLAILATVAALWLSPGLSLWAHTATPVAAAAAASIRKRLRFRDLVALGIVANRVTLKNWIKDRGFPPGCLVGPNTRLWDEDEIAAWLASRPTDLKPVHPLKSGRRRGRPRNATAETTATAS
jgi:predicted DNA-binding transcriptional regulator AlpA